MSGFFKVPNDVAEALLESDPDTFRLYCLIAYRAAYKRKPSGAGFMLEKGECDMTQKQMADALGVSRKKVRISITKLENLGVIEGQKRAKEGYTEGPKKGQRRNTLKLVDCWAGAGEGAKEGPKKGQEGAKEGPLKGTLSKKKTKTKTNTEEPLSACADGVRDEFDALWKLWPPNERKNGKAACLKKFKALSSADRAACATGWREYCEIMTPLPAKHFVPLPATWINQRRWCDDRETWRKQRANWSGADKPSPFMHNARAEQGDKFRGMK